MENRKTEINEKCCVFSKSIDMDLDYQENLQSYNDDMLKIIRCCVNNFIVNTAYQNSCITVYGKSRIFLTYISESTGCLSSAEFEEDFEKNISLDSEMSEIFTDASICNKYCNYRVINQRRIDIHNSFQLNICAYACVSTPMLDEDDDVLIDKQQVAYVSRIGSAYVKSEFEDSVSVTDGAPVKKVINVFADTDCNDVKLIDDKMLVKTGIRFSILYTTDSDKEEIRKCERTIEVSTIVDIAGIKENDIPFVRSRVGNLFYKVKADDNNELTVIELMGDINLACVVYRQCRINLSEDSYSLSRNTENTFSNIDLDTDYELRKESFSDTVRFEFEAISISQILDLSVSLQDDCTLEMNAFILDSRSELQFVTDKKKLEFVKSNQLQAYISSFDYVIKSESIIEVRITINYISLKYERKKFSVVSDVEIKGDSDFDSPALVVYFADENERLWDIAKTFKTSVELIKKENELTKDVLETKRVLLIPGV